LRTYGGKGGYSMVYKCEKCQLFGSGFPASSMCPCCRGELKVKIRAIDEDKYGGEFVSLASAMSEILAIMYTFTNSRCQIYVSRHVDEFLNHYGFGNTFNYKIDSNLRYLEMNVR
jgi:hypothetical protein